MSLEADLDRLYQLPLHEFTSARNTLAKTAGAAGSDIKTLQKPPVAAWAVNQLYWKRRSVYDALVEAASELRKAHAAVLSGKAADLRAVSRDHEDALESALKASLDVLKAAGHPASEATRQAIATTLRGLPSDEPPGRLTRTLQPGGFEMLAGIPLRAASAGAKAKSAVTAAALARSDQRNAERETPPAEPKALARAREAVTSATRALRAAEHAARREEFEAARTVRDAEKASRAVESARRELEAAQETFEQAEREATEVERRRDAARKRADEADEALKEAKDRVRDAEKALTQLTDRRSRNT